MMGGKADAANVVLVVGHLVHGGGRAAIARRVLARVVAVAIIATLGIGAAFARDDGQWGGADPAIREWYKGLMQPDVPTASCCGEADAYWADEVHVRDGKTYAVITDDRDDAPLHRPHVDIGTEIEVPPNKLKWDRGNPTGHGVVFMSRSRYLFCYVQPGGA